MSRLDGRRAWKACRKYAPVVVAVGGSIATVVQILTAGTPTTTGMMLLGAVVVVCLLPMTYRLGGSRKRREVMVLRRELKESRNVLEAAFAAHRPYSDERTIIFVIGEEPGDDAVQDRHITTANGGRVVRWCVFEAFGRGKNHVLSWENIDLHVSREPEGQNDSQQAEYVRLESKTAPRALVAFVPPRPTVTWVARYRTPGYWDSLRKNHVQDFTWNLPAADPADPPERRSSLRAVTVIFRVSAALGALAVTGPTREMCRPAEANGGSNAPTRDYKFTIDDVAALFGPPGSPVRPISWFLKIEDGGTTS